MKKSSVKTWTDQPDEVEGAEVIIGGGLRLMDTHFGEVRKLADGRWSLTVGNLFGSQTILCRDAECVIRALGVTLDAKDTDHPITPPDGCILAEPQTAEVKP